MKPAYATILVAGALLSPIFAHAGPSDYIYTPTVEYGEKEIDFKYGTARNGSDPHESAASIGFGYGATEWWFTEIYLKYKSANGEGTHYDAIEWENKFQLTETGKYPVDVGFLLEIERPKDHAEGWEVKWGPLFQTEFGKIQLNANLLFQRSFKAETPGKTELQYQWQAKYRWLPKFEFGLQGFGEMGEWNRWAPESERIHKLGPAVFGKLPVSDHQFIKYNAAWLFAASSAAPEHTVRVQVEYEFRPTYPSARCLAVTVRRDNYHCQNMAAAVAAAHIIVPTTTVRTTAQESPAQTTITFSVVSCEKI